MLKLSIALLTLCLAVLAVSFDAERFVSHDGRNTPKGILLRIYLVDRYRALESCVDIRTTDDKTYWLESARRAGCPDAEAFEGMHLERGAQRLYYWVVAEGRFISDHGEPLKIGPSPYASPAGRITIGGRRIQLLRDPRLDLGKISARKMQGHKEQGVITPGLILAHEAGHECGGAKRSLTKEDSAACAIRAENRFRQERQLLPFREVD
ncbi:MAG: hypothetical protein ABI759_12855 [Candidatus Solibacter sp.]